MPPGAWLPPPATLKSGSSTGVHAFLFLAVLVVLACKLNGQHLLADVADASPPAAASTASLRWWPQTVCLYLMRQLYVMPASTAAAAQHSWPTTSSCCSARLLC
jgi:hypothetical protein